MVQLHVVLKKLNHKISKYYFVISQKRGKLLSQHMCFKLTEHDLSPSMILFSFFVFVMAVESTLVGSPPSCWRQLPIFLG